MVYRKCFYLFGANNGWGNITSNTVLSLKAGDTSNDATYLPKLFLDTNGKVGIEPRTS